MHVLIFIEIQIIVIVSVYNETQKCVHYYMAIMVRIIFYADKLLQYCCTIYI